ncbi:MAG: YafY family transcriptional regulator [Anaerolineaceae bacterium]|nr:YafY family transcriptional regulator [Anaerolineaceae bacterium]
MRADRLISLILLLQNKGKMKAEEISKHLEVSLRTVYRDIESLCMAGIPLVTQSGVNGGISLDENYQTSLTGLSFEEIQSIFILSNNEALRDIGLEKAAGNLMMKLIASLPSFQKREAGYARQRLFIDTKSWFLFVEPLPFLSKVQQAVWEDKEIEFLYEKPGHAPLKRRIQPYGLVSKANTWYLVGCQTDHTFRTFRISRFLDLNLLDTIFERDMDFDLENYWKISSGFFESQFSADYEAVFSIPSELITDFEYNLPGRYVKVDELHEGRIQIRVSFFGEDEALMTVFRLRTQVNIIEPQHLIERIREISEKSLNYYQN